MSSAPSHRFPRRLPARLRRSGRPAVLDRSGRVAVGRGAVGCCLLALLLAGCGGGAASVAVPRPTAAEARLCQALHRALPQRVDGQPRQATTPASDLTAAWGSPAIVLRCGVPRPAALTPGTTSYDPTADAAGIDGVDWLPQQQSDGSVRCTTTALMAWVEVTIPAKDAGPYGDMSLLTDLAPAIRATVPTGLDQPN